MYIYITLEKEVSRSVYLAKLSQKVDILKYRTIGNYYSQGYETIIIDFDKEENVDELIRGLTDEDVFEIKDYMSFYYWIDNKFTSLTVNTEVRRKMQEAKYKIRVYNSHSENGVIIGRLDIKQYNPKDIEQERKLVSVFDNIAGIIKMKIY